MRDSWNIFLECYHRNPIHTFALLLLLECTDSKVERMMTTGKTKIEEEKNRRKVFCYFSMVVAGAYMYTHTHELTFVSTCTYLKVRIILSRKSQIFHVLVDCTGMIRGM